MVWRLSKHEFFLFLFFLFLSTRFLQLWNREGVERVESEEEEKLTADTQREEVYFEQTIDSLFEEEGLMGNKMEKSFDPPVVMGDESLMSQKGHGTCTRGVQSNLRWSVDAKKADEICCFNRHYAEHSGYFSTVPWVQDVREKGTIDYFDSIHGKRVFSAPVGREFDAFLVESQRHGWPSFRDQEVDWENVRILPDGECVTVDGVHLGHNLPDSKGNRYCINLVCIAGNPSDE